MRFICGALLIAAVGALPVSGAFAQQHRGNGHSHSNGNGNGNGNGGFGNIFGGLVNGNNGGNGNDGGQSYYWKNNAGTWVRLTPPSKCDLDNPRCDLR